MSSDLLRVPKVSIVTVVLNAEAVLEGTMRSVLDQTYPNIEYIIVDGGSRDGTLDIVRRHEGRISRWISQPDRGIADAFNKGVGLATGEYFTLVNAGDEIPPGHIQAAVETLEAHPDAAFAYGDLYLCRDGQVLFMEKGMADYQRYFGFAMKPLNHPSLVCRRDVFARIGLFDLTYRIAMDFDWLTRLHKAGGHGIYCDRMRSNMEVGGLSQKFAYRAFRENRRVAISAGINPIVAWGAYLTYVAKYTVRQTLETILPPVTVIKIRAFFSRNLKA